MDPYLELVKDAIKNWVKFGKMIPIPQNLPKSMLEERAGVFVSLHQKGDDSLRGLPRRLALAMRGRKPREQVRVLRGCIGTYFPTQKNIGLEIIHNAIEAATSDPRFPPVTQDELPQLIFSVDILSQPELVGKVVNPADLMTISTKLDPKKYGIIISAVSGRRALLLPDIPGVETIDEQVQICRQKAWISKDEPITISRFTVERHAHP